MQNLITKTEDFTSGGWSVLNGTVGNQGDGSALFTVGSGLRGDLTWASTPAVFGQTWVWAADVKLGPSVGTSNCYMIVQEWNAGFLTQRLISFTQASLSSTSFTRFVVSGPLQNAGTTNIRVIFRIDLDGTGGSLYVKRPMLENVTGQSNQNPSEYVSVGVLSSPYIQTVFGQQFCCGVDGVAWLPWQNGNVVNNNVVTEGMGPVIGLTKNQSAYLSGATGVEFTTPSAAANQITGDIDIRAYIAPSLWSPVSNVGLVSKNGGAPNRSYDFLLLSGGTLQLRASTDGSTFQVAANATVNLNTLGNATALWVRGTRVASSGSVTFYTSQDGVNWTQLGAVVAATAGSIASTANQVEIGSIANGSNFFVGTIYRAQIYNGINGTLAVDFNPNDASTSSNTWTSSTTGETWTINGSAKIINNPRLEYLAEEQRTNLCLQSADFTTTWAVSNGSVSANSVTAPDGTASADKVVPDATNTLHSTQQSIAKAGSALSYTVTVYAKAAGYNFLAFRVDAGGANGGWAVFDLSGGTVNTAATAAGAGWTATGATITQAANGFWRCALTVTTSTEVSIRVVFCPYSTGGQNPFTPATFAGDTTSGVALWGAQLEQASFATSYIPTTTASVTRNADNESLNTPSGMFTPGCTVYVEGTPNDLIGGGEFLLAVQVIASSNPIVGIRKPAGNYAGVARAADGSVHDATNLPTTASIGVTAKLSVSADRAGNVISYIGGGAAVSPGTGMANLDQLTGINIGNGYQTGWFNAPIRRGMIWGCAIPARLQKYLTT